MESKRESILKQKEEAELKVQQYENKIKLLQNRKQHLEKKADRQRTHHLCNMGGAIQRISKEADSLTKIEFYTLMEQMKKEKYRFTKAKEKYKAEHEGELRQFYMVKRKLKEKGFEKEPFPLRAWQRECSELSAQREAEYQEYKHLQKDLTLLYQIKGDVDKAMREKHPEMLRTDKTKETTL